MAGASFTWNTILLERQNSVLVTKTDLGNRGPGGTFGIAVDLPIFFANLIAIQFMILIVVFLIGFCISITEADWVDRNRDPENSEPPKQDMYVTAGVRRIEKYGWCLFGLLVLNAIIFHPNHFGFGEAVHSQLQQLPDLFVFLVLLILVPTTIIYVVARPLYFLIGVTPNVYDSQLLSVLIRFQLVGWCILAAWWLLYVTSW